MKNKYLLAVDYGTQSVRALIFDYRGQLVTKTQVKIQSYQSPQFGWAEQSADYCWQQVCEAINLLWQEQQIAPEQIAALSLTTQRNCVVHFDKDEHVLRPLIMWPDSRRASELPPIPWHWRMAFALVGISSRIRYFQQESEINWVRQHQGPVAAQSTHIGFLSGYLHHQLTDRLADSIASQVGYIPFDYQRRDWSRPGDWRWHAIAVRRDQMLPLVEPGEQLGSLTQKAALFTGLPAGLPVIAAGADKACETLAAGGDLSDVACLSLGTTATVAISQRRYREAYRYLPPYPSLLEKQYINELQLQRGFWLLSHFIEQYGASDVAEARQLGISPEALICSRLDQVPPGCDGLVVQPFWSPGVIYPGPEARGSILGFSPNHGRLQLYRALIEGILYSLKQGLERLQKIAPEPVRLLRISGGGAQSDEIMQMAADIFGLPCERLHTFETSGLGAAIAMAKAVGHYPSIAEASNTMIRVKDRFEPNRATSARYQRLYRHQARDLYKMLKPAYQNLLKREG